jgi:hypothetical protein
MPDNKILLFTIARSGSTYICMLLRRYFIANNVEYSDTDYEIANIAAWKNNVQNIIEKNKHVINELGLSDHPIDRSFMNTVLLYHLTRPQSFVYKYFPFDSFHTKEDEILALSEKHGLTIICLYRKNILDVVLSNMIKYHGYENQIDSECLEYLINETVIYSYELYFGIFNKIKNHSSVYKVIAYEDLSFHPDIDINLFYKNTTLDNDLLTKKDVDSSLKQQVLLQYPNLIEQVVSSLKKTTLPIVNDYYVCLEK